MVFDSRGNLFVGQDPGQNQGSNVIEVSPIGTQTDYAAGFDEVRELTFVPDASSSADALGQVQQLGLSVVMRSPAPTNRAHAGRLAHR